jgi:transposase
MPALAIRQDRSADELRRLARHEPDRRAAMRLLAIASALEGLSRADAARLAGMERQALRDAVIRYNADGPGGLHDRPRSGRPAGFAPGQQAALKAWVLRGPNPERDGVSAWRLVDICAHAERVYGTACATARGAWRGC